MRPRIALAAAQAFLSLGPDGPLLLRALAAGGYDAEPVAWDAEVDWSSYDAVIVRSTWDYCERVDEFVAWAERVEGLTRLANPARVIRWNVDKRYLRDLEAAGVPVVPTRWIGPSIERSSIGGGPGEPRRGSGGWPPDSIDLPGAEWAEYVIKPAVSACARHSGRFGPGDEAAARALVRRLQEEGRWTLVQPYLGRVDADGETGVYVLGGEISHAIRKGAVLRRGAPIEEGFALVLGQSVAAREPREDERALALQVIDAVPGGAAQLLFARIDMIRGDDGAPRLLEAELVEPSLFLPEAPGAAERFCRGLDRWLQR